MCLGLKIAFVTLGSLLSAVLLCFLAFLYLAAPGRRPGVMEKYKKIKYAHRGLHGESIPENSLAAFAEAKRAGYGVELDVRLSRDGRLVVFHDDTLLRMCGVDGKVSDYTYGELSKMRLLGTDEKIPLFSQVLDLLGGEVALLVEIKMKTGERGVIVKVNGHGSFRKRIIEMGFVKGNKVKVILNAPLRDPIEYEIIGYKISTSSLILRFRNINLIPIGYAFQPCLRGRLTLP